MQNAECKLQNGRHARVMRSTKSQFAFCVLNSAFLTHVVPESRPTQRRRRVASSPHRVGTRTAAHAFWPLFAPERQAARAAHRISPSAVGCEVSHRPE